MEITTAVAALGALAQETRLAIYRMLVEAGPGGVPAGGIADALALPAATLSFHLAQLKHAGLVTHRRDSRRIIYAANYATMNALMAYLTENCCRGAAPCAVPGCAPTDHSSRVEEGAAS